VKLAGKLQGGVGVFLQVTYYIIF